LVPQNSARDVHAGLRRGPHRWLRRHWSEMIADTETRLVRPRQLYAGPAARATHGALVG
jgi:hypothetical protein